MTARRKGALLETLESMERCATSLAAHADNDSDDVIKAPWPGSDRFAVVTFFLTKMLVDQHGSAV